MKRMIKRVGCCAIFLFLSNISFVCAGDDFSLRDTLFGQDALIPQLRSYVPERYDRMTVIYMTSEIDTISLCFKRAMVKLKRIKGAHAQAQRTCMGGSIKSLKILKTVMQYSDTMNTLMTIKGGAQRTIDFLTALYAYHEIAIRQCDRFSIDDACKAQQKVDARMLKFMRVMQKAVNAVIEHMQLPLANT